MADTHRRQAVRPHAKNVWTALLIAVGSLGFQASAQVRQGTIAGQVIGLSGEEVSRAPIEAKSMDSGRIFRTSSSGNGSYSIQDVPPGKYEVSSPVAGFERKEIEVRAGETARLDIHFIEIGNTLGTIGDADLGTRLATYNRPPPPAGPPPRTPEGQPDFSGYWQLIRTDPVKPEMLPWAEALAKYRVDAAIKDSPSARCLPNGVSRIDQLIQTPKYLVVLMEAPQSHRLIFLDGRDHPKEPDPTWFGHSVGKWNGDTLVVDRIGFNEGSWLDAPQGLPHTDLLHVVERYRRPDLGHLEVETTIDDPGAYVRPWTRKGAYELRLNQEVNEYVCNENNVDPAMVGK
jgi:Carboxypeptidase regulatory-like domain